MFDFMVDADPLAIEEMCSWTEPDGNEATGYDSSCVSISFFAPSLVNYCPPDSSGCEGLLLDAGNPGYFYLWNRRYIYLQTDGREVVITA